MALIPLEDSVADIIGKAMHGLQLSECEVASAAGVTPAAVASLRAGHFDEASARAIAPVLQLGAEALAALGHQTWYPQPVALTGLVCFTTPYQDMTVNNYLVFDPSSGEALAVDTGADCRSMLAYLTQSKLTLKLILLTHTHADHVLDLAGLQQHTGAPAYVGEREPLAGAEGFAAGRLFRCGTLRITTHLTWGHSRGGITYGITGLDRPVALVGDAVFAGSMGGCRVSYADALRSNRDHILSLPADTVICPGHGPLTSVGEERVHNPFFT
ncbi:MAG: MBL fold metallo-hydrolase [Verrucomicrobia bacterium]|nr:MAG: MBL fold metallo-hydrolase [Verrucomicrobiota bacterium]